jgi:hypothetical protein
MGRWTVAKQYREYKLRIQGKINGEEITPKTLPLSRLAEYLADFATLLGYREHVHFAKLEEGSAAPVALVDMEKDTPVRERVKQAATGFGPLDANRAYAALNEKFTQDEGYGEILEKIGDRETRVIDFPGKKRQLSPVYGPVKEAAFVQGELKRVGGQEPTIPVWLEDADRKMYYCEANKAIAVALAPFIFQQVRLYGLATWERDENAAWHLLKFEVQNYQVPLAAEDASTVIARLRSVPESDWNKFEDPLQELRRIRHGKDEIQ